MEKIDKAIEILQAFKEGKTIEAVDEWNSSEVITNYHDLIMHIYHDYNLGIKQEPTYRPYTNAEEFLKESKKHGGFFKKLTSNKWYQANKIDNVQNAVFFHGSDYRYWAHFKEMCECYKWADDDTPCGILENKNE